MSELKATQPDLNIELVGVNNMYASFGCSTNRSPWVQDTNTANVWGNWSAVQDYLYILDAQNNLADIMNLGVGGNDPRYATNRDMIQERFLAAATVTDSDVDHLPDDWEQFYFTNLLANPNEDPDGDGDKNFAEYAFGTDPLSPAYRKPYQVELTTVGLEKFLTFTFRRRAGWFLDYIVETSNDLVTWTNSPLKITQTQAPRNLYDGSGMAEVKYSLTESISNQPHAFLRVRAVPRKR